MPHTDGGSIQIDNEFKDPGRGPDTSTVIRLDERGYPVHVRITGNNDIGGEVDVRFEVLDQSAVWQSNVESGSVPAARESHMQIID